MADDFQVTNENFSKAERRVLLFQVDLGNKNLNTILGARGLTDTRAPQDSVRISDPVDYDNPSSPIYWRKVAQFVDGDNNNTYVQELKKQFDLFLTQFQAAITDGTIKLNGLDEDHPYIDISDFTKKVEDYSVRLDGLENKIRITLARPESTDLVGAPATFDSKGSVDAGQIIVNFNDDVFGQLNPNENDIIVIKNAYSPTENFDPEYIGVVTKVQKSFSYGRIDSFTLEIDGLSKILYSTEMIKNKAIRPGEFVPGIELNDKARTTPYSNNFDKKNIREVFRYILEDSLSCKELDSSTSNFFYRLDPSIFISFDKFGLQHNIFVLIALYLMSVTEAPDGAEGSLESRLFPQLEPDKRLNSFVTGFNNDVQVQSSEAGVEPRFAQRPILDFFLRGLLERGDHRAYNRMARTGVERFFSEMTKPADILGEVRSNTYSDVFESRDGVIVCRPPRYNKVENAQSYTNRTAAADDIKNLLKLSPQNVWEFNPSSGFVIKSEEIVSIGSIAKEEKALESRIDVKAIFPFRGEVDFPTALYVDSDILFRYGLRTHGAVTNPNAYNKKLARLFAPIALAMVNAPTRTIEMVVKDSRKFFIGQLYYFEAIDMVAYLVQDTINHGYAEFSTRSLSFSMLRKVIRRPIAEIMTSKDEVLNVGMMFTSDFPNEDGITVLSDDGFPFENAESATGSAVPNPKNLMYTKGKQFLEALKRDSGAQPFEPDQLPEGNQKASRGSDNGLQAKSDVRLVMFKYVPCIEDLIMEIESTPRIVEPPVDTTNSVPDAQKQALNLRIKTFVQDGFLWFSTGNPVFKALSFVFQLFRPALFAIQDDAAKAVPEKVAGTDPTSVQYQRSAHAPESVAGILGYIFPPPLNQESPFIEVAGNEKTPLVYQRTPFRTQALADPPQNLALSQVLTNQLASLDLYMKFKPVLTTNLLGGNAFAALRMSTEGSRIPQLYYLSNDEFRLFGSNLTPGAYISSLTNSYGSTQRGKITVLGFQEDLLSYPSVLKLNKDRNAFENDFFSIPARDGKFNLPFGHFILKQKSESAVAAIVDTIVAGGFEINLLSYYRAQSTTNKVEGGSFTVAKGSTGDWVISPTDSNSKVVDENTGKEATINDPPLDRSSPAPNDLYFTSPFLEPTIERMLDVPLPVKYGGNMTSAESDIQKQKSTKGALTSQAFRQSGQAINVSPDYLFIASKGEIVTKTPIYARLEKIFKSGRFCRCNKVENAATASLVLPSGKDLGPKTMIFYTLFVVPEDERQYSSKIQDNTASV